MIAIQKTIKLDRPHTLYALYKGWEVIEVEGVTKLYDPTEDTFWIYESSNGNLYCAMNT